MSSLGQGMCEKYMYVYIYVYTIHMYVGTKDTWMKYFYPLNIVFCFSFGKYWVKENSCGGEEDILLQAGRN